MKFDLPELGYNASTVNLPEIKIKLKVNSVPSIRVRNEASVPYCLVL